MCYTARMSTIITLAAMALATARLAAIRYLSALVFAVMAAMAPTAHDASHEAPEARMARLHDVATAIATVATAPRGAELEVNPAVALYRAGILVGIGLHESHFDHNVDIGPCRSAAAACDGGMSVSVWQLLVKDPAQRSAYQHDRMAAAAEALRIALGSIKTCHGGLGQYASGGCTTAPDASAELEAYVVRAHRVLAAAKARADDPYAD